MWHFSQDVPYVQSIPSLQKDLNLPPPPNNTYKGLLMIMLYSILCKVQVVQNGHFLRENPGSGRTRNLRQEPFHDFVGVCWKLGSFYPKNIGSRQTSGSVRVYIYILWIYDICIYTSKYIHIYIYSGYMICVYIYIWIYKSRFIDWWPSPKKKRIHRATTGAFLAAIRVLGLLTVLQQLDAFLRLNHSKGLEGP